MSLKAASAAAFPFTTVGRIAEVRLGKMLQPKPVTTSDSEVHYLRAGSLEDLTGDTALRKMWASPADHVNYSVRQGDLIVAEGGDVGRAAFVPEVPADTIIQNSLHRIRPRDGDIRFLKYAFDAIYASGWLDVLCNKATFGHLTHEKLSALSIPWPTDVEQQAIADFLDAETARIDALIDKKRQLVGLLHARYTEERRLQILRGLDPVSSSGLAVPGWRVAQLGVLIGLQRGHDLPIDRRNAGTVPVVSSGGPSGWHDEAVAIGPGVVTGRYGTIGEVYYVDGPYWPLNTTLYVHDFRGHDPRWVYHLLSVLPLDSDSAKSAVTGINRNVIGVLRVPVPPLDEQQRLAKELDAKAEQVELLTSRLDTQINLLKEHRQALITGAVTGRIEVPGAVAS